jgi:hypothetical protein
MLEIAKRAAGDASVHGRIELRRRDAAGAGNLFPAGSFDIVRCHSLLECVDFAAGARYIQVIARHSSSSEETGP